MGKTGIALGLLTIFVATTQAAGQERLTQLSLDEALQLAVQRNAILRAKEYELQATRANEVTAGLRPNPTGTYLAEQFFSSGTPQHTATVGQTIETGGKRRRRLESARAAIRVTALELADASGRAGRRRTRARR